MTRVFSGIQPTGDMHLGNYVGAVRQWAALQETAEAIFCVVDLHALTTEQDPAVLRGATLRKATELLAAGLDPDRCTLFVQSHVAAHAQLAWLMECTASFGELRRMTQFKEKSAGRESVRAALFTYPCLMAADILLYDSDQVPVGDDQRQHLELARDLAQRWNARYGPTFVVPEPRVPPVGARIMDLQDPAAKMSKSRPNPQGRIELMDPPDVIVKKIKRAVTDAGTTVRFDPTTTPGVSNLLELLAASTGVPPAVLAEGYEQYGPLKADAAAAVVDLVRPYQERFRALAADPGHVRRVLSDGAAKAAVIADAILVRAQSSIGLAER